MTHVLDRAALPSTARIGLSRGLIELKQFFRQKEQVIFTFSFPALILLLLGSVFDDELPGTGITASQIFAASMIGAGIVATSFLNLGISVALDREDGTLKRLRGTPMSAPSYFVGKMILVAVASLAEVVVLLVVGVFVFDLDLPTDPMRWLTFVWVFVLGVVSCSLLGIAISGIARSAQSAAATTNVPYIALLFLSGVYITIDSLPDWMLSVGSLFPIKWAAQGFRSVFLPDAMTRVEPAGAWEHGMTAVVLGGWCVVGLVLCLMTFRWTNKRAG
jgi:ABC-2 type transport system permease protein